MSPGVSLMRCTSHTGVCRGFRMMEDPLHHNGLAVKCSPAPSPCPRQLDSTVSDRTEWLLAAPSPFDRPAKAMFSRRAGAVDADNTFHHVMPAASTDVASLPDAAAHCSALAHSV